MKDNTTTNLFLGIIVLVLIIAGGYFLMHRTVVTPVGSGVPTADTVPANPAQGTGNGNPAANANQNNGNPSTTPPIVSTKEYRDTAFGFVVKYSDTYSVSVNGAGAIVLTAPQSTNPITLIKTTNTAPDANGKWGPYTISYGNTGFMVQQQNEQDGTTISKPITPIAYTTSELPIFNGGTPSHGWGTYSYIVALSHTKFVKVSGPDMIGDGSGSYASETDPTFAVAKAIALQ
jgi:hypothetical protein